MKLIRKVIVASKDIPKPILVIATILPWGLTAVGAYLAVKSAIEDIRGKK
jgi:hypothetical protein